MDQATALNVLKAGENVFLTGSAGAGKTYVLNQYIRYLKARQVAVAVTASTGIAATHMNGMTVHTWAGIGIKDALDDEALEHLYERKYLREGLERVQVLIIDEISMLHARQFGLVNRVLKYFKGNQAPFGGIQVIVAGDFFQLPPVSKSGEPNREKFAFMSPAWVEAGFQVCYLTSQHRQGQDELTEILNAIRQDQVTSQHIDQLQQTVTQEIGTQPTRLYTHNVDVDAINQRELQKLKGKAHTYQSVTKGNEKVLATLSGAVRAPEALTLKVGTRVMFVRNDFERGYSNGTLGEVVGFIKDNDQKAQSWPRVRLHNGYTLTVTPETWSVDNDQDKALATYQQLPLCLAWAMTIHKSQGMTLEAAEIDLSATFERGQGYVALSRLQSLSGLRLLGLNVQALQLDPLAMKADRRFQELSAQVELRWAEEATAAHRAFLQRISARQPKDSSESKSAHSAGADRSGHTLAQTRELFEAGHSIGEIAQIRQLAESTVIGHLVKLSQGEASLDISRVAPPRNMLEAVQEAYDRVLDDDCDDHFDQQGRVKIKPIVDLIRVDMSYDQVRLALAFVEGG